MSYTRGPWWVATSGLSGLGQEPGCAEPVPTAERDALVARMQGYRGDYYAQRPPGRHWAESHPDLRAALEDFFQRFAGLQDRPKLLRCDAGARQKAELALRDIEELLAYVKRGGATVVEGEGFWWKPRAFPPMRPYFVRGPFPGWGGGPKPRARGPEQFPGGAGILPGSGSVSASGVAPTAPSPGGPAEAPSPVVEVVPTLPSAGLPPAAAGVVEALTEGDVFGIPKRYLVYGIIGLFAYRLLTKR